MCFKAQHLAATGCQLFRGQTLSSLSDILITRMLQFPGRVFPFQARPFLDLIIIKLMTLVIHKCLIQMNLFCITP